MIQSLYQETNLAPTVRNLRHMFGRWLVETQWQLLEIPDVLFPWENDPVLVGRILNQLQGQCSCFFLGRGQLMSKMFHQSDRSDRLNDAG